MVVHGEGEDALMQFAHPLVFWFLPLAALPFFWPRGRGSLKRSVGRSAALLACLLALATPTWKGQETSAKLILLLDESPSVDAAAFSSARRTLEGMRDRWDAGPAELVEWGGRRGPATLAAALRLAEGRIPEGGRGAVVLATDGVDDEAGWSEALARYEARGLPIHPIPLASRKNDPRPVGLEVLSELRVGQRATVAVTLVGPVDAATLELEGRGNRLAAMKSLSVEDRRRVVLEFEPSEPGPLTLSARLLVKKSEDPWPADNTLTRTVFVKPPLDVAYLGWRMEKGLEPLARLVGPGFHLHAVEPDGDIEKALGTADLVVVDDLPSRRFPIAGQEALVRAVKERGVGLFVCGGRGSLAPGGYFKSPLEDILPVELTQKEEKRDPSTTLVVIIDTSGSMGGTRVQLAKEVARLAIRRLLPHDKVGIVEFYGAKRWAAPIQPASNVIEIQRAINRLDAGGGTVIMPAIEEAYYGLQNVNTRYKHVLVLTDGGVESGAFEPLLRKMAEKGINVSTVLVGPEAHSEFLVNMANWGKGRFYAVPNRFNLPEVILKRPTSARLPVWKTGAFALRAEGPELFWRGIDRNALPLLDGYLATRMRPAAENLIVTRASSHPVLARWQVGLGRVTVFTSEPAGKGTDSWRKWSGFGPLLARVLARTARDARDDFALEARREGRRVRLVLRATGSAAGLPAGYLVTNGGKRQPLSFIERAPGLFEAAGFADPARDVTVRWGAVGKEPLSGRVLRARRGRISDLQADPARALDLAALARTTGGRVMGGRGGTTASPSVGGGAGATRLHDLAPWFYLAALVLFLGDVIARRLPRSRRLGGTVS